MPRRPPGQSASSREAELEALLAAERAARQQAERSLAERETQQTATAEVLQAISRAPTDLQRVLDTICASAGRLCGGTNAGLSLVDGSTLRLAAQWGRTLEPGGPTLVGYVVPLDRATVRGRAVLDRQTV